MIYYLFTQLKSCFSLKVKVLVIKSCLTLCDPTDSSLPGSSVHGIFQARLLGWVAISQPHVWTHLILIVSSSSISLIL